MHHPAKSLLFFALFAACSPRPAPGDAADDSRSDHSMAPLDANVDDDHARVDATQDASAHDDGDAALVPGDGDAGGDSSVDASDAGRDRSRDLTLRWIASASHPDRLVEALLVDEGDRALTRVVLRGYNAIESLPLRSVLPAGSSRFDWFVDRNADLLYQPPPDDHSSSAPVGAGPGPVTVELRESSPSRDITRAASTNRTLNGRFTEFEPHVGVFFQIEIEPEGRDETVALFRYRALPAAGRFDFALRAVLVSGQRYTARWFIDLNDNEVYDPRGDHGGSLTFAATDADLTLVHEHHANRAWIE